MAHEVDCIKLGRKAEGLPKPPFKGELLQVMPWPEYQEWTGDDLLAIYEYLKAIPCTQTPAEALAGVHACF